MPMKVTTTKVKLPAFLATALINGDMTGLSTDQDMKLLKAAYLYTDGGSVVDCGEPFFSHTSDLAIPFAGDVCEYTVAYYN